jgi:autotransporter-associated beta strand protein
MAQAVTIDAIYFGQTHVMKATQSYFTLVGERATLIKVHVTDPAAPVSPAVSVTLSLNSQTLTLPLSGPANLPVSIPDGPGVVQHTIANSFIATIPADWVKTGLTLTVNAGVVQSSISNLSVGAPSRLAMNMTDVHFFSAASGNYPTGTLDEIEAKWPVADLDVRRSGRVIFSELVMPPPGTRPAVRVKSTTDFTAQTGFGFDGEQSASLAWNGAIRRAAGRSGSHSLYYLNIYGVGAGGQAGGFAGVGNGGSNGILLHELGHALSLPHWGDSAAYPYKGAMHGITAPVNYNETHAGPTWAYDIRSNAFIPPTRQVSGVPTYRVDPMQGGGTGQQDAPFLMNHFSDYSINQMRSYLQSTLVVWNPTLGGTGSYAKWNQSTGQYSTVQSNNGVQYPTVRDTQVITIMASVSGASPQVNMVYPPIGPYTGGLIRLFDPTVAADRTAANSIFSPSTGSDVCVRLVQGGVQKTYILAASMVTTADPNSAGSLVTEAINLPAADGAVTRLELLATPDVEDVGLPINPQVLYSWSAFSADVASFEVVPNQINATSVSMRARAGVLDPNISGNIEYQFTEISGNVGGTTSGWQTSRDYTDSGLSPSTAYAYRVTMRIGTGLSTPSASASVTTEALNIAPPTILSRTPLGTALSAPVRPVALFSRPIIPRSGNVTIRNLTDNTQLAIPITNSQIVISGSTLTINPTVNLLASKNYAIRIDATAISDRQENFFSGIANDTTWSFSTLAVGATLTYRPSDGNVSINATQAAGGVITSFRFENLQSTFMPANYSNPVGGNFGGINRSLTTSLLTDTSSTNVGAGGTINLGDIFQPNLSLSALETYLSSRVYTGQAGSGQRLFALAVVGSFPTATWIADASGLWSIPSNWDPGIADGSTANFTHNITAERTVSLDSDRTLNQVVFGDGNPSTAGSWVIDNNGVTANNLILSGTAPGVTVNTLGTNQSATISAVIQGTAGFVKRGGGTLVLGATNTFSGNRTVNEGVLHAAFAGALGAANNAATITIAPGAILRFSASNMFGEHQSQSAPTIIVNGGTITNTGDNVSSLRNITLNSGILDSTEGHSTNYRTWALNGSITSTGTSKITDSGGDSGILLRSGDSANNTDIIVQSGTLDVSGTLHNGRNNQGNRVQVTSLTKLGAGVMILSSSGNTFTGNTNINAGTLLINGATSSTSAVAVASGATLGGTGMIGHNVAFQAGAGLAFQLNTAASTHDKLVLAATKTMTFAGASTLTLTTAGAAVPGDYTLLTAPGGFGASVPPATVILPVGWAAAAPRFVGNDLRINITSTSPYASWAGTAPFSGDANGDGVRNGVAFMLGAANPNENAVRLLPTVERTAEGLILSFSMLNATNAGASLLSLQHSSDLGLSDPWEAERVPSENGILGGVTFTINPSSSTKNSVRAVISSSQARQGRLFGRLQAEPQ